MLRRAASGHIEATHWAKFAAASRIADAVISGWPEAPSSPLQGCGPLAPGAVCGGAEAPEFGAEKMFPNRLEIPPPDDCALASPAPIKAAAIMTAAVSVLIDDPSVASYPTRCPSFRAFRRPRPGFQQFNKAEVLTSRAVESGFVRGGKPATTMQSNLFFAR